MYVGLAFNASGHAKERSCFSCQVVHLPLHRSGPKNSLRRCGDIMSCNMLVIRHCCNGVALAINCWYSRIALFLMEMLRRARSSKSSSSLSMSSWELTSTSAGSASMMPKKGSARSSAGTCFNKWFS